MTKFTFTIEHDIKKGPFPIEDLLNTLEYINCKLDEPVGDKQTVTFMIDPMVVGPENLMSTAYHLGAFVESGIILQMISNNVPPGSIH